MWQTVQQESSEEVFVAGERVRPGIYRQIGSRREVQLETEDTLPASLDGRVACYERVRGTWAQMAAQATLERRAS